MNILIVSLEIYNNTCSVFHIKYKAIVVLGYAINVTLAISPAGIA